MSITYFIPDDDDDDKMREVRATRRIMRTATRSVSVVDFSPEGEELFNELYCGSCWDHGFKCPLGLRILQKGEQKGPDYENFLQCHQCGNIIDVYKAISDSKIQDTTQVIENPFDHAEGQVYGVENRATQRRKQNRKAATDRGVTRRRSKRFTKKEKLDPDIASEKGIVNIVYDSSA